MGQSLRVLNAVRFHEVGIPITYQQSVQSLKIEVARSDA